MQKKNLSDGLLLAVKLLAAPDVHRAMGPGGPMCGGFFHQPVRPKRRTK